MAKANIIGLKDLRENTSRYIREVKKGRSFIVMRRSEPIFSIEPIDEDDDRFWNTVVDFTEINPRGIPAGEVVKALQSLIDKDKKKHGSRRKTLSKPASQRTVRDTGNNTKNPKR